MYDALYGTIHLSDSIWKIIPSTELQHLREVRLCDINSLCLTGGANVNRYEHAIGTCYLAHECIKNWPRHIPLKEDEKNNLLLAALLHDVVNPAFGHSVEHVEHKDGFDHENSLENLILGKKAAGYQYKSATLEPIYFGMPMDLAQKLDRQSIKAVSNIVAGKGNIGPLINGAMDLDNIDNVFRLAYHIGLVRSGEVPLNLARSLWMENGELTIKKEAVSYAKDWFEVRKKLYSFLLLNPEEFSGKCMLREAAELAKTKQEHAFNWFDVDYELLKRLSEMPLVREEFKDYLFSMNNQAVDELKARKISSQLFENFERNGHKLTEKANMLPKDDGWQIHDRSNYYLKLKGKELHVYKLLPRGVSISEIIQRLMKGILYGCVGIFSTEKTDKAAVFKNVVERRELEDDISVRIRKRFGGRFKNAIITFHSITDVNKTKRQIKLKTDLGDDITIGQPSKRLLIGVFFRNPYLNMYEIYPASKTISEIREEIKGLLSDGLDDPKLREVELYAEAKQEK